MGDFVDRHLSVRIVLTVLIAWAVSFSFSSEADPEFKACWALTNLRPLWGEENIDKRAKRTHLL